MQAASLIKGDSQAFGGIQLLPISFLLGPGEVIGTRTVTGFAGDIDFGPGGVKAVELRIVILMQVRGMTFGAHVIPVLLQAGPVEGVFMRQVLAGIEMKPALSALLLRPAVPGDAQRLIAAVRKTDQVLL